MKGRIQLKCSKKPASLDAGNKRHFIFKKGNFRYIDVYSGESEFSGIEKVYVRGELAWTMRYKGGLICSINADSNSVYPFLRKALRKVTVNKPFRGPAIMKSGEFVYTNKYIGVK